MPISNYPRLGHALAPVALKAILDVPIPKSFLKGTKSKMARLSDLDASAWDVFSPGICKQLSRLIVVAVRTNMGQSHLLNIMLGTTLPSFPPVEKLEDLDIEQRTYNCLSNMQYQGWLAGPNDLSNKTIRDVLELEHFGAKSIVDLLTSLEAAASAPPRAIGGAKSKSALGEALFATRIRSFHMLRFPTLPANTKLCDLDLAVRTFDCLAKQGFEDRLEDLANLTLGEVLNIPGFGMMCLVDYLDSVEKFPNKKEHVDLPHEVPVVHLYLEDELRDLVWKSFRKRDNASSKRNIDVVLARFGWDGNGAKETYRELGKRFDLTKQRLSQICKNLVGRLKNRPSMPPLVAASFECICRNLPCDKKSAEKRLQTEGLTRTRFQVEGLIEFCDVMGYRTPFYIKDIGGCPTLVPGAKAQSKEFAAT